MAVSAQEASRNSGLLFTRVSAHSLVCPAPLPSRPLPISTSWCLEQMAYRRRRTYQQSKLLPQDLPSVITWCRKSPFWTALCRKMAWHPQASPRSFHHTVEIRECHLPPRLLKMTLVQKCLQIDGWLYFPSVFWHLNTFAILSRWLLSGMEIWGPVWQLERNKKPRC